MADRRVTEIVCVDCGCVFPGFLSTFVTSDGGAESTTRWLCEVCFPLYRTIDAALRRLRAAAALVGPDAG